MTNKEVVNVNLPSMPYHSNDPINRYSKPKYIRHLQSSRYGPICLQINYTYYCLLMKNVWDIPFVKNGSDRSKKQNYVNNSNKSFE